MLKTVCSLLGCVLFLSCAKPTDPESLTPSSGGYAIVARLPMLGFAQDVEVKDTLAYVAQGEGGLAIVSIADRTNPRVISLCQENMRGSSQKIFRKDTIVYAVAGTSGVNVVNVSNPNVPAWVHRAGGSPNTSRDVEVLGEWWLHAVGSLGWQVGDISSSPMYPDIVSTIESPGYAQGMVTTVDSSLLITCGEMGLAIYDLRDIGQVGGRYDTHTPPIAWIDLPGYAVDVDTMGSQRVAFVACGTAGVQVVDFSDTSNVRVVGSYATGGYAKEIACRDGRLYVTTELRGLQVLSVQNPAAPQLIGVVDTENALGLAVDQNYVYVADEGEGLIIIAIPH
jgi:hypothetical protein